MSIKFTVIIPTRERADTLLHSLKTCVAQDYDNLEIVVCDNFSQDHTRDVVFSFQDQRIKYIRSESRLSMMENFELAFSGISEGYVFSMGDDDGMTRNSIQYANNIITETQTDAIVSDFAHYFWPNVSGSAAGQLIFSNHHGYETRDCHSDLQRVLYRRRPFQHIPCIYYGYIKAQKLIELRKLHGKLFITSIVDLASSICLSLICKQYVFSKQPLAIAGTSNRSNGMSLMRVIDNEEETILWKQESASMCIHPFQTTPSIKLMLAEACYALNLMASPLLQGTHLDLKRILRQAYDDVVIFPRSKIDTDQIDNICASLGYPKLESRLSDLFISMLSLRTMQANRFFNDILLDGVKLGITDIDQVAQYMHANSQSYSNSLFEKIRFTAKRYKSLH